MPIHYEPDTEYTSKNEEVADMHEAMRSKTESKKH